jgi:hypothetical protein
MEETPTRWKASQEKDLAETDTAEKQNPSKFGRKSLGKITPWEEVILEDQESKTSKFGRKSMGKITPWEEFTDFVRRSSRAFSQQGLSFLSSSANILRRKDTLEEFTQKYKLLVKDFDSNSITAQYFLLFDLCRQFFITLVILSLLDNPLVQAALIHCLNLTVLIMLIVLRPYKYKKEFFQSLINEVALQIIGGCVMYLAILDNKGADETEKRMKVGWLMVFTNIFLIYFFIAVFAFNLVAAFFQGVKLLIKYCKQRRQRGSTLSTKVYPEQIHIKDDNNSNIKLESIQEQNPNEVDSTEKNSDAVRETPKHDGVEDEIYNFN